MSVNEYKFQISDTQKWDNLADLLMIISDFQIM